MRRCWGHPLSTTHCMEILEFPWFCWQDMVFFGQHIDVIFRSTIFKMWVEHGVWILGFRVLKKTRGDLQNQGFSTWPTSIDMIVVNFESDFDQISSFLIPHSILKYILQQPNRFCMIFSQLMLMVRFDKQSFLESYDRCLKQDTGAWQKSSSIFTTNLSYG